MSSNLTLSATFAIGALMAPIASAAMDPSIVYRDAVARMQAHAAPAFLTYRANVSGSQGSLIVSRGDNGEAELAIVAGAGTDRSWDVAYRASDGRASIALPDGTRLMSTLAIFDPAWSGVFAWIRHGVGASVIANAVLQAPSQNPSPAATLPPLIAVVTALNEKDYAIRDGGDTPCADGSKGRRLWMRANTDPLAHPLTGAIVNLRSGEFCAVRFHEHRAAATVTFDDDVDLQLGLVGSYYVVTAGTISAAVRPFRRPGWFRVEARFAYDRFAFPATLPDALFTATATP